MLSLSTHDKDSTSNVIALRQIRTYLWWMVLILVPDQEMRWSDVDQQEFPASSGSCIPFWSGAYFAVNYEMHSNGAYVVTELSMTKWIMAFGVFDWSGQPYIIICRSITAGGSIMALGMNVLEGL